MPGVESMQDTETRGHEKRRTFLPEELELSAAAC